MVDQRSYRRVQDCSRRNRRRVLLAGAVLVCAGVPLFVTAQESSAPKGRTPSRDITKLIQPLPEVGFQPIFDGKSMNGWDGDPKFWRVEGGSLVGETTTDKQPEQNT